MDINRLGARANALRGTQKEGPEVRKLQADLLASLRKIEMLESANAELASRLTDSGRDSSSRETVLSRELRNANDREQELRDALAELQKTQPTEPNQIDLLRKIDEERDGLLRDVAEKLQGGADPAELARIIMKALED